MSKIDPSKPKSELEADHATGHRHRLKNRFLNAGVAGLQDYELMELILFRTIPRGDVKPLAKRLIAEFGSFAAAISAPRARLLEFKGVGDSVATDFKVIEAAVQQFIRGGIDKRQVLGSWSSVIDYCRAAMAFENREIFRILFLDKRNGLIADEVQQTGTVDHTPVYPREVIKRALELAASAVILVHNHPSGDPTPSSADISMTRRIMDAGKPLGVMVHDHIIIGRQGHSSLRGMNLI